MSERIEIRNDYGATSAIRGIGQARAPRPDQTRNKFARELDRRLSREEDEKDTEPKEDEIIIGEDASQREEESENPQKEKNNCRSNESPAEGAPGKIDIVI